ncbi:hypothetical protein [Glycomyces sp. NRRL B-16210]|uniref:hypothetical protein n=1 Tax=Glycomyces sp. NRRL B-16210 TaxID=1463821 RepID=UPI00105E8294|nr:hypothetical protein [Glycomyces sp. NRRL B-16210]
MKRFQRRKRASKAEEQGAQARADTAANASPLMIDAVPIGPGLLYPDMLPANVWGSNLRGILSSGDWDRIRIPVCERAGNRCEVCGQPGFDPESGRPRRPDCHELWHFEVASTSAVQRLAGLIALCPDCHRVQHAGRAAVKGELSLVVEQLRAINGWTDPEIRLALENADERFQWRRRYRWDLNLGLLAPEIHIPGSTNLIIPASQRMRLGNSYLGK